MAENPVDLGTAREQTLEAIRKEYRPLLASAHVAELMQCTIGEVREEVLAVLLNRPAGPDAAEAG